MKELKDIKFELILIYGLIIFSSVIAPSFMISNKNEIYTYLLRPVIWICIFLVSAILTFENHTRYSKKKDLIKSIFIITLLYIIVYYMLGIFVGYTKSSYLRTFYGITKNIWAVVMIIGLQEYVRTALIYNCGKKKIMYVAIAILFMFVNLNWNNFMASFSDNTTFFKYMCSTFIPTIVKSALYTYIAYYGGYYASAINRVLISLASVISPVLPDINWFFTGVIEILTPFVIFLVVNYEVYSRKTNTTKRQIRKENPAKMAPFFAFIIIFILFVAGIFKYMPVAVMSNSMLPVFGRGSVVVIKKVEKEDLKNIKVGDIIEYSIDNRMVIHRVIEIVDPEKYIFKTKGDHNKSKDNKLVTDKQVYGVVEFSIPYIGYLSVWFSELVGKSMSPEDIELGY